jgi:hypothetical protein
MSDVHPSTYQKYGLSNVVKECEKRGVTKNKREREIDLATQITHPFSKMCLSHLMI